MTAMETVFAWCITLFSALGLLLSSRVLEGRGNRRSQFLIYYTNQSNLLMLIVHGLLLCPGKARELLRTPTVRYMSALCILVTFVIYFFVLTRFGRQRDPNTMEALGVRKLSNAMVHYVVPLSCQLEWLIAADKSGLPFTATLWWLLIPIAYVLYVTLRARSGVVIENTGSLWPYGFMDRDRLGTKRWMLSILRTAGFFYLLGLAVFGLAKLIG